MRQKGLDVLIRAMKPIGDAVPDARLLIAGDGPERSALERLAHDLGLSDRVSLLGYRDDIERLMRRAWLLVHPARWEGFGLVLLEAMRVGLPVVATGVSAIPEVAVAGPTRRLVPPDEPAALAEALIDGLGDERFRRDAGARGFERLVERSIGSCSAAWVSRAAPIGWRLTRTAVQTAWNSDFWVARYKQMALFPEARDRLHLLGALDAGGPLFVPDPWGRGADVYAATYGRIAEALTAAISG